MFKLISSAAVVGLIVLTVTQDASAGRRRCRRCQVWYAPAPVAAPAPAAAYFAPAAPAPSTAMAQPGNGAYRSYSYEPGPAYQAPARPYYYQQPQAPSESHFFRADRKAHGLSWYRNQ